MGDKSLKSEGKAEHLERVSAKLNSTVLAFCEARQVQGKLIFRAEELLAFVRARAGGAVAPDSPSRILRELRRLGAVDYVILNRRDSLYQLTKVEPKKVEPAKDFKQPAVQRELFAPRQLHGR